MLSLIYLKYLCKEEEKQKLIKQDEIELLKIEKEIREKYNSDKILKKQNFKSKEKENTIQNKNKIIKYKETIIRKIIKKIK